MVSDLPLISQLRLGDQMGPNTAVSRVGMLEMEMLEQSWELPLTTRDS